MEKTDKKQLYEIDDFQHHCNLWNIIPGGSGKGIVQLRKIVDHIHANNYSRPGSQMPSILLTGEGKVLAAKAVVNSLSIEDVRICSSKYIDCGILSSQFFDNSTSNSVHIITDIELLTNSAESVLWRNLMQGKCNYYNFMTKKWDTILYCNGLIILTVEEISLVAEQILKEISYVVKLEPLTSDQKCLVVHQQLKFCDIEYEGEQVLQAIVGNAPHDISLILQFLRMCIMIMRAELDDYMTIEMVEKAKRLSSMPVPPSVPGHNNIPY